METKFLNVKTTLMIENKYQPSGQWSLIEALLTHIAVISPQALVSFRQVSVYHLNDFEQRLYSLWKGVAAFGKTLPEHDVFGLQRTLEAGTVCEYREIYELLLEISIKKRFIIDPGYYEFVEPFSVAIYNEALPIFLNKKEVKTFLEEIEECIEFIEPTGRQNFFRLPVDGCHFDFIREMTTLEKKFYTLMIQKKVLAEVYESKMDVYAEQDLSERYIMKALTAKNGTPLGNLPFLIDRNSVMRPALKRPYDFYLHKLRIARAESEVYKKLLYSSISTVRSHLERWQQRDREIDIEPGFKLWVLKVCEIGGWVECC